MSNLLAWIYKKSEAHTTPLMISLKGLLRLFFE